MLLYHIAVSCCIMLLYHVAVSSCCFMLLYHDAVSCCCFMLLYHVAVSCCCIMLLFHVLVLCCCIKCQSLCLCTISRIEFVAHAPYILYIIHSVYECILYSFCITTDEDVTSPSPAGGTPVTPSVMNTHHTLLP